jgi:hypothetical protein
MLGVRAQLARRRAEPLRLNLPPRKAHKWTRWSGWEVLWEGESYRLRDMGATDKKQLAARVEDAVLKTLGPLQIALAKQ